MAAITWRRPAPRVLSGPDSFRQRAASWRARNWHRLVLSWFGFTLGVMAIAAEPSAGIPLVPRVIGCMTAAGLPLVLILLP
jgi:hypothetical protein